MLYLIDYGAFLLGCVIYILRKAQKLKELGEANPNPNVSFSWAKFIDKEYINFVTVLLGGIALVFFAPLLMGGATVDIKSTEGAVVATLSMSTLLAPFSFLIGLAGPSALFSYFGKYEKTLLNRVGVDNNQSN